ncbi:MAG TPA: class I SAM-dependent methyltransferase [Gaiellaceae bacterium]
MHLDDPALVAAEYADDARLRRRAAAYTGAGTVVDARVAIVSAVAAARPSRVLEVGCGWGELAQRIADAVGVEVTATDLSPHMVELARAAGIAATVEDVQSLSFPDETFDVVVAAWMLYHVPDRDRAVSEIVRVLRPGGRLVATTNSIFHLHELRELVGSGRSSIAFSRESGNELLARHFERVEREDIDGELEFVDRREVEEYVRASISMSPFVANLPPTIDAPFRARRANSIFVAEKAA